MWPPATGLCGQSLLICRTGRSLKEEDPPGQCEHEQNVSLELKCLELMICRDLDLVLLTRNAALRPEANVLGHARPNVTRQD